MQPTITYDFPGIAASRGIEAAASRRVRHLHTVHGGARRWRVRVAAPHVASLAVADYAAEVEVGLDGGEVLRAEASGPDSLSALRVAFNRLEEALDLDREDARARAAQWLFTVRRRLGGSTGWPA